MLNVRQILVSAIGLCALGVGLSGCGLKGPLYLPTDPAAAQRATLPELLTPSIGKPAADADADADAGAAPAPAPAASAPVGAPR